LPSEPLGISFDIVFIDNESNDRTVEIIRDLCARDPRVRLIVNTRNFGQMRSPTHGIFAARGRAVIGMCADFQDSPSCCRISWRAGRQAWTSCWACARREVESSCRRSARPPIGVARNFGDYQTIPNATGFGLYSRVVDAIEALNEPEPFIAAC
jgi:glycosyltransferase involved in cell wall biosynthesis